MVLDAGGDGNEGVLHIPEISNITGTSPSNCLVSYPGHSLRRILADWAMKREIENRKYT